MVTAISSSIDRASGSNADYSISSQIAALEQQLAIYQKQLENAQKATAQSSQQLTEQINAQITQLEAQIAQLKTQQARETQQAQQISATEIDSTDSTNKTGHSNFPDAIVLALAESISDNANTLHDTATTSTTAPDTSPAPGPMQNPQAALHTFMHNLFSALGQENGTAATTDNSPESAVAHTPHRGEHISASIQSLIQHLNENTQTEQVGNKSGSSETLNNLNSSFHDLIGLLNSSQEQTASITGATLQSFLHNLSQDLSNGPDISGALVDTEA
jgi:hypothetical protein